MSISKTKKSSNKSVVQPLLPRIHYKEFLSNHPELGEMQIGSFLVFVGNKEWMRPNEWETALKDYLLR